jgi:hypothetical protein
LGQSVVQHAGVGSCTLHGEFSFGRVRKCHPAERAMIVPRKALADVKGAVKCSTKREKGGTLNPDKLNKKTGDTVPRALESKQPLCLLQRMQIPIVNQTPV